MLGMRLAILSRVFRERVAHGPGPCVRCSRLQDTGSTQRWSSSAKPKDEVRACDRSRMELIEVLEIRVQQLQADEGLPLFETRKFTSQQEEVQTKINLEASQIPKRWMQKLQNEQVLRNRRQKNIMPAIKVHRKLCCQQPEDLKQKEKKAKKMTTAQPKIINHSCNSVKRTVKTVGYLELDEVSIEDLKLTGNGKELLMDDKDRNRYCNIQRNIFCYLEMCIFLGDLKKALLCINYYLDYPARRPLLNTAMFNLLLQFWAKKGSLHEIGHIFSNMETAGLKPNLESYAAALVAFGRTENYTKGIESCLRKMEMDGMSVDQLFQDLTYHEDEKQMVLKAIHYARPEYTPPPKVEIVFDSPLVKDFYKKQPPPSYPKLDFIVGDLQERFEEQLKLESCHTATINSVEYNKPVTEAMKKMRTVLATLRSTWEKDLLHALQNSKHQLAEINQRARRNNIYPYLCLLDDEQYVEIMLQSLTRIPPTGESFFVISHELGLKIYNRFVIRQQLQGNHTDRIRLFYKEYCELLSKEGKVSGILPRELWENVESESFGGQYVSRAHSPWPRTLLVQLGTHLVDLMVKTIKIQNNLLSPRYDPKLIPVLYHMYSFRSTHQIGLIKPHPIYSQIFLDAEERRLTFDATVMPMKCPPLPWISPQSSPYLLSPVQLMRCTEGAVQHQLLLNNCQPGKLFAVLDSINQLGACAWRINRPILDIIVSIFNDKGNEKLGIPPPLSEAPVYSMQLPGRQSPKERQELQRELALCRKKTAEMFSLRMEALYKLSIAQHLQDQIFWFPHNMDFRGRTYPCPSYLNHLGSDVTRALLVFAEGHPLGPRGLDWMKIHLINLTGLKKGSSLQQRKECADEIMEDILDSADHPLTGRKWWMEVDEPWQALACCIEIAKAIRSPDPAKYVSHVPVHQDGSCNGLQHYAALGRDEIGAKSVNLMPCVAPQDVYSEVAQQVEEFRKKDADNGVKIAQILEGFISRKVVKQTVMTVVYGVTRYGGRLQVEKRLHDMESFPQRYNWDASHYVVKQVFNSLKEMFSGTRDIQHWLTESARMISKSGKTVEWVTPLGLPIIQPYHRTKKVTVQSDLQRIDVKNSNDVNEVPDILKQKNAFPPNFIHSLDSTHMLLTSLYCCTLGLTFVSVHDCFWTHADTVDVMNKVCREQFVSLHSQPILQDLSKFLQEKYCSGSQIKAVDRLKMAAHFSNVPLPGTFKVQNVNDSTYFFS